MINKYLLRQILKMGMFWIAVFGLRFFVFVRPITADELLIGDFQNGGFEEIENEMPIGWTAVNLVAEEAGEFSLDKEESYLEGQSARIDYSGSGQIFWLQRVKLEPGKTYRFTGRVNTKLKLGDSKSWARFEFWWEDEDGGFIDPPLVSEKATGYMNWQERRWLGQAPEGAVAVNIRALMTGNGTSWFDGITWEEEKDRKKVMFLPAFIVIIFFSFLFMKRRIKKFFSRKNEKKAVNLG